MRSLWLAPILDRGNTALKKDHPVPWSTREHIPVVKAVDEQMDSDIYPFIL